MLPELVKYSHLTKQRQRIVIFVAAKTDDSVESEL